MRLIIQLTKQLVVILSVLSLLAGAACKQREPSPDDKLPIDVKIVALEGHNGWGYDIYVDHKLYIRQDRIPAIPGIYGFATKEDAAKTAQAVVELIKKGESPALSAGKLKQMQIQLPPGADQ